MDFSPLSLSEPAIAIHAYAALLALALGTAVLLRRKGDRLHKAMGWAWVVTMAVVALTSFFITEIRLFGPYSFIHALSVFTLVTLVQAIWAIRHGNVRAHRSAMIAIYCGGLILAGAFTLLPGRRMHAVLFADGGRSAALLAAGIALFVAALLWRRHQRRRA